MIGTILGHYKILEKLGAGGMGEVYRAEDTKLGRDVAIKVLPEAFTSNPERFARFEREAQVLASLNHPNIAAIYDLAEDQGIHFLVLELAEGEDLAVRLSRGPVPVEGALPFALQIAEALEAAHEKGVVHRDLKPANVMVGPDGQAKVLDFGLAKAWVAEPGESGSLSMSPTLTAQMTQDGVILGTAPYMSPEQARGQEVDKRTDIWAFGVVLWEMLTGKQLFDGVSITDVLAEVVNKNLDWTLLPRESGNSTRRLLERCLDRDAKNRLRDIGEARYTLSRIDIEDVSATADRVAKASKKGFFLLAASAVAVALVWIYLKPAGPQAEALVEQLTANPLEFAVSGGAVSPSGDSLVFADARGLNLRFLSTGESRSVDLGDDFHVGRAWWFPDQSRLLVSGRMTNSPLALWLVNPLGGPPRKIQDGVITASISPSGNQIAFIPAAAKERDWREIWLMNADGTQARTFMKGSPDESFWWLAWSPDGERLAYGNWDGETEFSIETRRVADGEDRTVLLSEARLFQNWTGILPFVWSPDGRLIFGRREEGRNRHTSNLWAIETDVQAGRSRGDPVRLTQLAGFNIRDLSITDDSSMLGALLVRNQADVYFGELNTEARSLENIEQITADERDDYPSSWTTNGASLLLSSSRLGSRGIFKWSRSNESLELVSERGSEAVSTADGSSILLQVDGGIVTLPASGGASHDLTDRADYVQCTPTFEPECVFSFVDGDKYVFSSLNPSTGTTKELTRISYRAPFTNWSLAPDRELVAVVHGDDNIVRLIDLLTRDETPLEVENWSKFEFVEWAADGQSLFLNAGISFAGDYAVLLQVTMDGQAHELRAVPNVWHVKPTPSPDGRYLAFAAMPFHGNMWLIRDF